MGDLDIDAIRDECIDDLLPTEKRYSIVHLDHDRPPSDSDAATKMYETDDLEDVAIPPAHLGISVIAYNDSGEAVALTEGISFPKARERVYSAIEELQKDT